MASCFLHSNRCLPFKTQSDNHRNLAATGVQLQGVFINWSLPENIYLLAPPEKCLVWSPPKYFKYENHIEVLRHLDFFRSWGGGQSGTLTLFRNRLLTGQHLANSRGGQLKKNTLYVSINKTVHMCAGENLG